MGSQANKVVIVATPTNPLVPAVLHELSHQDGIAVTIITRATSISFSADSHDHTHQHGRPEHHSTTPPTHIKTDFSSTDLDKHLSNTHTLICLLTGSDLHLSSPIMTAAASAGVSLFIPSEFGLDTSNPAVRKLLPPYQTRFEIQEMLRSSGTMWKAIYSGVMLEEAMKTDGVFGVDVLWGSAVVFPGNVEIAISTYEDVAKAVVGCLTEESGSDEKENEVHTCSFVTGMEGLIGAVEKELDRTLDRYEGGFKGAKKEAEERMRMGYFDGGVALMGRVAVWDPEVDAWGKWGKGKGFGGWEGKVAKAAARVRAGEIGGDGCGC